MKKPLPKTVGKKRTRSASVDVPEPKANKKRVKTQEEEAPKRGRSKRVK